MATVQAKVSVDVDVLTQDRGDHWAGRIEQIGTTVYAEDEAAVLNRATEMLAFVISSFRKHSDLVTFRQYLDAHGINHNIDIIDAEADVSPARMQRYPLRVRPEETFEYVA